MARTVLPAWATCFTITLKNKFIVSGYPISHVPCTWVGSMRQTGALLWVCQILPSVGWKWNSSHEPIHFQISGLPADVNVMDCELLQPEFGLQSWNSAGGQCQIAVFSDSSCSHLVESASTAYDSEAVFERRVVLGAAGVFDVWIPGHRQANCFRMRLPAYFIRSTDHSKALSSSITVFKGERYDASFASRIYQATSRLEIAIFRSYGPGLEVNSAVTVMGCVFAVLMIVHAAGLVRKAGGAQSLKRSLMVRSDVGPDKIGAPTSHDGHVPRGGISSAEERITCDALADFCLGLFLSLEFCLSTLYLVTHTFVTEAIVASTLVALLMPILLVPYLLGMEGGARSPVADVSESKEHPAKRWSKRLNAWKPAQESGFCVKSLMLLVFFALCLVYHIQAVCFYIHKYTFACRRRMKRCKCKCVVNFLIAALAAVSRALVSPSVYTIIYTTSENKQVVCATYAKCLCFCCSLPVLLFIIIDIAMQPTVPNDLMVALPSDETILWSLITCVVLLLGRQLLLFCATLPLHEDCEDCEDCEGHEEEEADPEHAFGDAFIPDDAEDSYMADMAKDLSTAGDHEVLIEPEPPWNRESQVSKPPESGGNILPASANPANQVSMHPDPPVWNNLPGASGTSATSATQVCVLPGPPAFVTLPVASGTSIVKEAGQTETPNTAPSGSAVNETVLRRLSRISQHFLGAKANSGEGGVSSSEISEVKPQTGFLKAKRKKKKKKERPLEME
eukprot:s780_g5.t1